MKNILITYNSNSEVEENTALRMQTLSNLYGYTVLLPYRINSTVISGETKTRIGNSRFVLAFCLDAFSEILKQDLDYALTQNKPIIVIYDETKGRKINFPNNSNVREVFIDYYHTDEALHEISTFIGSKFTEEEQKQKKAETALGTALVAVGLGLLTYWAFSNK